MKIVVQIQYLRLAKNAFSTKTIPRFRMKFITQQINYTRIVRFREWIFLDFFKKITKINLLFFGVVVRVFLRFYMYTYFLIKEVKQKGGGRWSNFSICYTWRLYRKRSNNSSHWSGNFSFKEHLVEF